MPDFKGRKDFPEVPDDKIKIGDYSGVNRLTVVDIYSPKGEPTLRDQMMEPLDDYNNYDSPILSHQPVIVLSDIQSEEALIKAIDGYIAKQDYDSLGESDFDSAPQQAPRRASPSREHDKDASPRQRRKPVRKPAGMHDRGVQKEGEDSPRLGPILQNYMRHLREQDKKPPTHPDNDPEKTNPRRGSRDIGPQVAHPKDGTVSSVDKEVGFIPKDKKPILDQQHPLPDTIRRDPLPDTIRRDPLPDTIKDPRPNKKPTRPSFSKEGSDASFDGSKRQDITGGNPAAWNKPKSDPSTTNETPFDGTKRQRIPKFTPEGVEITKSMDLEEGSRSWSYQG